MNVECPCRTKGLTSAELLVYQKIQQAGNTGIWTRDIRFNANLPMPKLQKILKTLETRHLVKLVKSSTSGTKRIYMLYELMPSEELTGGQWCAAATARSAARRVADTTRAAVS